jgi:HlyD family secretion protein
MRRLLPFGIAFVILAGFGWTVYKLWIREQTVTQTFETESPQEMDLVQKTVATGAIVPRQEVEIKPRVSGVIEELYVEPGMKVSRDQKIAKIKIIPDAVTLNRAEVTVRQAKIAFDNADKELKRSQGLFGQGVISDAELQKFKVDFELKKQDLGAAQDNLQLVKEGAARGGAKASNVIVTSTVDGMVIDVPIKLGTSVIESNTFNPGSTIAVVADMGDMIFQGLVDESEVGKIKELMTLKIKIGAVEKEEFTGTLEYIAPKGKEVDGAIQFEIKASMKAKPDVFIRAGYSANADIVLDSRTKALAIREALLQFDEGKPYVEVEVGPQKFERRDITVGLSDGLHIEVLGGIDQTVKIKMPITEEGGGGPGGRRGPPRRR